MMLRGNTLATARCGASSCCLVCRLGLLAALCAMVFIGASLHIWGALLLRQTLAEEGRRNHPGLHPLPIQLLIKVTKGHQSS